MRIISESKDYYDCIQAQGQDQSIVYVRTEKTFTKDKCPPLRFRWYPNYYRWLSENFTMNQHVVGFCGKIYPVLQLWMRDKSIKDWSTCLTLEDVDQWMETCLNKKQLEDYYNEKKRSYFSKHYWRKDRSKFRKFFEQMTEDQNKFGDMFIEHDCPIFVATLTCWDERKLVLNARLNEFQFYRMIDPYTAFQELQMWVGNQVQPRKHIPEISDKVLAEAKGFDQWSFRKEPTKKKK